MRPERCRPSDDRLGRSAALRRGTRRCARAGRPRSPWTARSRRRARGTGSSTRSRPDRREAEQPLQVPSWKIQTSDAERGAERDDVEQQRLDRDDHRAGHEEQQHERAEHDEADGIRRPGRHRVEEVDLRRPPGRWPASRRAAGRRGSSSRASWASSDGRARCRATPDVDPSVGRPGGAGRRRLDTGQRRGTARPTPSRPPCRRRGDDGDLGASRRGSRGRAARRRPAAARPRAAARCPRT